MSLLSVCQFCTLSEFEQVSGEVFGGFLYIGSCYLLIGTSFPTWINIFFSCLITPDRTSRTMMNRSSENGLLWFVLDHRGTVSTFPCSVSCELWACSIWPLFLGVYSFYTIYVESFHNRELLNFIKCCLCIYFDHIFILLSVIIIIIFIYLHMLNLHCIPGMIPLNGGWTL